MGIKYDFEYENVCVITIKGKLDVRNLKKVDEMYDSCREKEVRKLVFNLKDMTFVDSNGLAEMIRIIKCAHQHIGEVDLVDNRMNVSEIFVLSGLGNLFKVRSSLEESVGL